MPTASEITLDAIKARNTEAGEPIARNTIEDPLAPLHRIAPTDTAGIRYATSIYRPPYNRWKTVCRKGMIVAQYTAETPSDIMVRRRVIEPTELFPCSPKTRAA